MFRPLIQWIKKLIFGPPGPEVSELTKDSEFLSSTHGIIMKLKELIAEAEDVLDTLEVGESIKNNILTRFKEE